MLCPCGSNKNETECCLPIIKGSRKAASAEELMRSRYTAYTLNDISYLKRTLAPESQHDFDEASTLEWAKSSKWKGLEILSTSLDKNDDKKAYVVFKAQYEIKGQNFVHHENSTFRFDKNLGWLFVDGEVQENHKNVETVKRDHEKIGRNDPCPCGSGKKYKKCCGNN